MVSEASVQACLVGPGPAAPPGPAGAASEVWQRQVRSSPPPAVALLYRDLCSRTVSCHGSLRLNSSYATCDVAQCSSTEPQLYGPQLYGPRTGPLRVEPGHRVAAHSRCGPAPAGPAPLAGLRQRPGGLPLSEAHCQAVTLMSQSSARPGPRASGTPWSDQPVRVTVIAPLSLFLFPRSPPGMSEALTAGPRRRLAGVRLR